MNLRLCSILLLLSSYLVFSSKNSPQFLRKKIQGSVDICPQLYNKAKEFSNHKDGVEFLKNYKKSNYKSIIIPGIDIDIKTTAFDFKFNHPKNPEFHEIMFLHKALKELSIYPLISWKDITKCCMTQEKLEGKNIFDDICIPLIIAYRKYGYWVFVHYAEKAFKEGMQNLEYILGEVPLTEKERNEKMKENLKNKDYKPFSLRWMKIMNPIFVYKGGQKKIVDEDNFDTPTTSYYENEIGYIEILRKKLSQSCAISSFIPDTCKDFVRICHYDLLSRIGYLNRERIEYSPKVFNKHTIDLESCVSNGYSMHCSKAEVLYNAVFKIDIDYEEIPDERTKPQKAKNILIEEYEIPKELAMYSVKLIYNLKNIPFLKNLEISLFAFHESMVKNLNLQRMIVDNFNNRFQNDQYSLTPDKKNCITSQDCIGIIFRYQAFRDKSMQKGFFTGIEEVDRIFRNLEYRDAVEINNQKFYNSVALGNLPFLAFWKQLKLENKDEYLMHEFGINFENGFLGDIGDYAFKPTFYSIFIRKYLKDLLDNEFGENYDINEFLNEDTVESTSIYLANYFKSLYNNLKENIDDIRKIINEKNKEVRLTDEMPENLRNAKNNEIYSLLNLEAIEDSSRIQPELGIATNILKKFNFKIGISLRLIGENVYNSGGIYFEKKTQSNVKCKYALESGYIYAGRILEDYLEYYPDENKIYLESDHVTALGKINDNLRRFFSAIKHMCTLPNKKKNYEIFDLEFIKLGFMDDKDVSVEDFDIFNEKQGYDGPKLAEKYNMLNENMKEDSRNFIILHDMVIELLGAKYTDPNNIKIFLNAEIYYLTKINGYKVKNKFGNLGILAKFLNFALKTMTFAFIINDGIWSEVINKKLNQKNK